MMHAGRVRHHLFNNIEREDATFLIVGYCTPDTPGGMLKAGIEEIKLFGKVKKVKATVKTMDSFSAHGDRKEMLNFISNQKSLKKLFLVHGEYDTQVAFREYLKGVGFEDIEIPALGSEYEL